MTKEEAYTQYEYEVALFEQWGDTNNITFDEWLQIKGIDIETKSDTPKDLEEAAREFAKDAYPDKHNLVWMFKRGAKWQKEQMMKEAVEGEVRKDGTIGYFEFSNEQQFHSLLEQFQDCDKVRIIIVKED